MPPVLRKIFDVSFEDLSNMLVQFASKDDAGNLYEKGTKEFESRTKHEIASWDVFYEAVRSKLIELTRTDVVQIAEFIKSGVSTVDGPANKLAAFQIFILGYIIDAARRNIGSWNFSTDEVEEFVQIYEYKASMYGSGLNAVGQMLKVINPFKKVFQRMLEKI